jgi:hypothetical protein
MIKMRYLLSGFMLLVLLPVLSLGQESVLRLRPYDGTESSFLNAQLAADTLPGGLIPANRVYVLQRGAPYLHKAVLRVNTGQTLRMRANDSAGVTAKPFVFLYPTGLAPNPQNPPGSMFDLRGNLDVKNIGFSAYFEAIDSNLNNIQGSLLFDVPTAGAGANIRVDSCILTNCNGQLMRAAGATNLVIVTNNIFANMGYLGRSNLGAGKGIDLRDASVDTLIFENNTFVNWQDRVIRHYNFANPQAGTGPINYMRIRHNTFANGMSYHGFMSLGSMGPRAIITDNLLIDPFSLGNDSDATRQAEFVNNLEQDAFGGPRMTWIFTTPNDTTQWTIARNYYAISDSGQAFWNQASILPIVANPALTKGSPLTYHINSRLGADSVNAFTQITPPLVLNNIPALMNEMNRWYRSPTGGNKLKNTPNSAIWNLSYDFDRRGWQYWQDTLDCAYSTSSVAYTGALAGYPVGDLNWFPTRYAAWLIDPLAGVGQTSAQVPTGFALSQNYPNPFNPATKIAFNLTSSGLATLTVYNILGQKVATVFQKQMDAGTHEVDFNASHLGTGVYFYRLESGNNYAVKKMMVLK